MSARGKKNGPPAVALRAGRKSNVHVPKTPPLSTAAQRVLKDAPQKSSPYSFSGAQLQSVGGVSFRQAQAMAAWMLWLGSEGRTTPERLAASDLPEGEADTAEWRDRAERLLLVRHLRMAITAVRHAGGSQADCAWLQRLVDYILRIEANRPCPVLTTSGANKTKSAMVWQCRALVAAALSTLIEARCFAGMTPAAAKKEALEIVEPYMRDAQAADFGVENVPKLTADSVEGSGRGARLSAGHANTWRNQLRSGKSKGVPSIALEFYSRYSKDGHEVAKGGVLPEADIIARSYLRVACKESTARAHLKTPPIQS